MVRHRDAVACPLPITWLEQDEPGVPGTLYKECRRRARQKLERFQSEALSRPAGPCMGPPRPPLSVVLRFRMYQYRITKYDPAYRDGRGAFTRNDWTSRSDIGRTFEGTVLTEEAYLNVESAYLFAINAFLTEAEVPHLKVEALENHGHTRLPKYVRKGGSLSVPQVVRLARFCLRELAWARLSGDEAFVHFGRDFYVYVGVSRPCLASVQEVLTRGLFVESFASPYHTRSR